MTSPHALRQDKPILFSGAMIRAILEGRKTQSRRIIKPRGRAPSLFDGTWTDDYVLDPGNAEWRAQDVRFAPGDMLWCRENVRAVEGDDSIDRVRYEAEGAEIEIADTLEAAERWLDLAHYRKKRGATAPSIHMPRWASRLTLEVTAVKVERLNDISDEDAKAEGIDCDYSRDPHARPQVACIYGCKALDTPTARKGFSTPQGAFEALWTSIHGPGSWEANPWIVAVSFKPHARNIDQIRRDAA